MKRLALAALLLPLASCGGADAGATEEQVLTVLAAASLTEVFTNLAEEFEKDHEGVEVRFSFGSSTTLAEQAVQGAPGDVLATADTTAMELAKEGGALDDSYRAFATNRIVLVVQQGNPRGISGLEELAGTDWIRCADDVPCGRVAGAVLASNGFRGEPVSLEVDVKAVLSKVASGEADAGFVYASDARAASGTVELVEVPHADEAETTYVIAPLVQAASGGLATEWIELVQAAHARGILTEAGFGPEGH